MRADALRGARRALLAAPLVLLGACDWFTDFRDQPKYEPWESVSDTIPFRANPQMSVPLGGHLTALAVSYRPAPPTIDSVAALVGPNPVAADARSLENGRKSYQINCAICHGPTGAGSTESPAGKYGLFAPPLVSPTANALSDGQIWGIIRNGRGLMPTYNRIPEMERWDIVNYVRGLQGRHQVVKSPAGYPGETGATLPAATLEAPTRPAPYYRRIGSQAGIPLGPDRTAAPPSPGAADSVRADTAAARPAAPAPAPAATPAPDTTRGGRA